MARLPKCPECEYQVDKDTQRWVKHSAKTYHEHCFQQFELQKQHRSELHEYICSLYRTPVVSGFILKQIKDQQELYKYTLKGIHLALVYFFEIQNNEPMEEDSRYKTKGIGIVPYIYEDAKKHFIMMANITQKASEVEFESKEDVVYMNQPTKKIRKNYIDIEGLLDD